MNTKKIWVLGDVETGKSSLISHYVNGKFNSTYTASRGPDFLTKVIPHAGRNWTVHIWEYPGCLESEMPAYARDTDVFIVLFDVTKPKTFDMVDAYIQSATRGDVSKLSKVILVGSKKDLEEKRCITKRKAIGKANQLNIPYFEVAINNRADVDLIFERAMQTIIAQDKLNATPKSVFEEIFAALRIELGKQENSCLDIGFFGSRRLAYTPDNSTEGVKKRVPKRIGKIYDICQAVQAKQIDYEQALLKINDIICNEELRIKNSRWDRFILKIRLILAKLGIIRVKRPEELQAFNLRMRERIDLVVRPVR